MPLITKNWNLPAPEWYRNTRDAIIAFMPIFKGLEVSFDATDNFIKHSDAIMVFLAAFLVLVGKYLKSGQVIVNQSEVKESVG